MPLPSSRRRLLAAGVAGAAPALVGRALPATPSDRAPPHADEVQRPPAAAGGDAGRSLLERADGTRIESWDAWALERERLREAWLGFLGPWDSRPAPAGFREVDGPDSVSRATGLLRRRIAFHTEPDLEVEAWLVEPEGEPPPGGRPGAVVFHSTTDRTIDEVADPDPAAPAAIGTWLARAGFVVLCPRCHLWNGSPDGRLDTAGAVARLAARHPGARGMRKLLHDGIRAVDLLASLPGVDGARIVAAGHSLGAKEAIYLAAFDDRVCGAVASEGGIAIPFSNWTAPWYLGAEAGEPGFARDHAELVALTLPRGLLVLGGEAGPGAADGDRSWPTIGRALEVGHLREPRPWLGLFNHRAGHSLPREARERLVEWLVASAGRGDSRDGGRRGTAPGSRPRMQRDSLDGP